MVKKVEVKSCKHESTAPVEILEGLPQSQAIASRHLCAICAYAAGVDEGIRRGLKRAVRVIEREAGS